MLDVYGQLVQGVEPRVLLSGYNQFTSLWVPQGGGFTATEAWQRVSWSI